MTVWCKHDFYMTWEIQNSFDSLDCSICFIVVVWISTISSRNVCNMFLLLTLKRKYFEFLLSLFLLRATNPSFKEVLSRIESHEDCRNLPMISFLILPMQRVTRLPLLMDVRHGLLALSSAGSCAAINLIKNIILISLGSMYYISSIKSST